MSFRAFTHSLLFLCSLTMLSYPAGRHLPTVKAAPAIQTSLSMLDNLPLSFELNQGQSQPQVRFLARARSYRLFLTADEAVFAMTTSKPVDNPRSQTRTARPSLATPSVVRMKLLGANSAAKVEGEQELATKANYFIGSDPKRWHANVSTYGKVRYSGVYPGIDLVYYGTQQQLEYDFVVGPGADPGIVRLGFQGKDAPKLSPDGAVLVPTDHGDMRFQPPRIYQADGHGGQQAIAGHYFIDRGNGVGFAVEAYDRTKALIIDPRVEYSTFLGGSDTDTGTGIAVDSLKRAYVTGYTLSTDFPVTAGAFQTICGTDGTCNTANYLAYDVFVTKLNEQGSALVYSTYIGGSEEDQGTSIAVDAGGNAYVTGFTSSNDFPVTAGAFQTQCGGNGTPIGCTRFSPHDAFVVKLDPAGSNLVYGTFLGGSDDEEGLGIAVNSAGEAYVAGQSTTPNPPPSPGFPVFPTTAGAFQSLNPAPTTQAFFTKLNASGSALVYSSLLGSQAPTNFTPVNSGAYAIAIDSSGDAYITGFSQASDFPVTPGAFQTSNHAVQDVFVAKFDPAQSGAASLLYSTFLGGSGYDEGTGIAVDSLGEAYVTGDTNSKDFPRAQHAYRKHCGFPTGDRAVFATKLNPTGSALIYSACFGGSQWEYGSRIAVDAAKHAYLTGITQSSDFPVTANAPWKHCKLNPGTKTCYSGFLTELNSEGSAIRFSTYVAGKPYDQAQALAVDRTGTAYVTGRTGSVDFPTTKGAFDRTYSGNDDAFVVKIRVEPQ